MLSISVVRPAALLLKSSFSMESSRAELVTTISGDLLDILIRVGSRFTANSSSVIASAHGLYALTDSDGRGSLEPRTCKDRVSSRSSFRKNHWSQR